VESGHHSCDARRMTDPANHKALREAAKALHRSLVRAALSWNVDPEKATHNPVFMRDGRLNYVGTATTREETYSFLRENGVLGEGFNGAHRLIVPLDQIDRAADTAFDKGIATERVIERLIGLLSYEFGSLHTSHGTFPDIQMPPNPGSTSLNFPDEAEEMVSVMHNLELLGYVRATQISEGHSGFQWTPEALPILTRLYLAPK
jgi:hypothetical protein